MTDFSNELDASLDRAETEANHRHHEYITLEHLLLALIDDVDAARVLQACEVDCAALKATLINYVDNELGLIVVDDGEGAKPSPSCQRVLQRALIHVESSDRNNADKTAQVNGANVLVAIFSERESHAAYFLQQQDITRYDAVNFIAHGIAKIAQEFHSSTEAEVEFDTLTSTTKEKSTKKDRNLGRQKKPKPKTTVGKRSLRNFEEILLQSHSIVYLIDQKIDDIKSFRPNSKDALDEQGVSINELKEIRECVLQLSRCVTNFQTGSCEEDQLETIANTIHELLIRYIRENGSEAIHWTFKGTLISLLAVVGSLCGVAPVTATAMSVIVGGKLVVDGLKAIRGAGRTRP